VSVVLDHRRVVSKHQVIVKPPMDARIAANECQQAQSDEGNAAHAHEQASPTQAESLA
jgi:hypothetical protein